MKTIIYENSTIENFSQFFTALKRQHPEILGAEWDKEKRVLKVFYQDAATELTDEDIRNLKIPIILRFKKKIEPPKIEVVETRVTTINENEFVVETYNPENVRSYVKAFMKTHEEIRKDSK